MDINFWKQITIIIIIILGFIYFIIGKSKKSKNDEEISLEEKILNALVTAGVTLIGGGIASIGIAPMLMYLISETDERLKLLDYISASTSSNDYGIIILGIICLISIRVV